jgi:hypothetical protein
MYGSDWGWIPTIRRLGTRWVSPTPNAYFACARHHAELSIIIVLDPRILSSLVIRQSNLRQHRHLHLHPTFTNSPWFDMHHCRNVSTCPVRTLLTTHANHAKRDPGANPPTKPLNSKRIANSCSRTSVLRLTRSSVRCS